MENRINSSLQGVMCRNKSKVAETIFVIRYPKVCGYMIHAFVYTYEAHIQGYVAHFGPKVNTEKRRCLSAHNAYEYSLK